MVVHIGATLQIRLNSPCAAAMRHFCQITLTSCFNCLSTVDLYAFASSRAVRVYSTKIIVDYKN